MSGHEKRGLFGWGRRQEPPATPVPPAAPEPAVEAPAPESAPAEPQAESAPPEPEFFLFSCPACQWGLEAPEALRGRQVACPHCGTDLIVPECEGNFRAAERAAPSASPEPPAGQPAAAAGGSDKGSTVRLEIPPDYQAPTTHRRTIVIKRRSK